MKANYEGDRKKQKTGLLDRIAHSYFTANRARISERFFNSFNLKFGVCGFVNIFCWQGFFTG
jgi:hypothetical protein